jgi:negative regulator of flagellin synthesis FlgM
MPQEISVSSKINDLTTSVTAGRTSGTAAPSRDVPAGSASGAAPADATGEVHITDTASQLVAIEQSLRDSPAVDSARVSSLRSAIEQGTYTVQPDHVATQLLQMERALRSVPDGSPETHED